MSSKSELNSELYHLQKNMLDWLISKDEKIKADIIDTGEVNKVRINVWQYMAMPMVIDLLMRFQTIIHPYTPC